MRSACPRRWSWARSIPRRASALSLPQQWKLRLLRAVQLASAVQGEAQPLAELDTAWDNAQRRLELLVEFAERATDATTQALGARLRLEFLPATVRGIAPTRLAYAQKVYHGNAQIARARSSLPLTPTS